MFFSLISPHRLRSSSLTYVQRDTQKKNERESDVMHTHTHTHTRTHQHQNGTRDEVKKKDRDRQKNGTQERNLVVEQ
jgi:hypothetical protein